MAARVLPLALLLVPSLLAATGSSTESPSVYRPKLRTPEALEPFLPYVTPGGDSFPEEKEADELAARLAELGARLRHDPRRATEVPVFLMAPEFRGGRLRPIEETEVDRNPALRISRGATIAPELRLDARAF
ncbi:MAG TPA: hypothetical protein VIK51_04735, partial [Vicinamibacteria bacterium]